MSANKNLKHLIIEALNNGVRGKDIQKELNCSSGLIAYYRKKIGFCGANSKEGFIKHREKYERYINDWLSGNNTGGRKKGYGTVSNHVRKYLFEKHRNSCSLCGWSEMNSFTNTIPLEVEHIDGDHENHSPENLTLLCPNCHSLTRGHSTKKGNGRRYYRDLYNKSIIA